MEEFIIQGKQTSFYKYCPGTFGYTLVYEFFPCSQVTILNKYSLANGKKLNFLIMTLYETFLLVPAVILIIFFCI